MLSRREFGAAVAALAIAPIEGLRWLLRRKPETVCLKFKGCVINRRGGPKFLVDVEERAREWQALEQLMREDWERMDKQPPAKPDERKYRIPYYIVENKTC
jgi:hypothetical protein